MAAVAQPGPDRAGEAGVVHDPVPAVTLGVQRVVVAVLAHEQGVWRGLVHRGAHLPGDVTVEVLSAVAARHVRDVDAPAVEGAVPGDPLAHHAVAVLEDSVAQRGTVVVELRQRLDPEPGDVVVVALPEVVAALRALRVLPRRDEPLVRVAGVVGGEVAEHAQPALVAGVDQPRERLVAAEHRVHLVEARGVIAVVGAGREERRQVDNADPEPLEVVEVLDDAVEVTAVELLGDDVLLEAHRLVPRHRHSPLGDVALVLGDRAGEAVGEDLVDHGARRPGRRRPVGGDAEVRGVGHVPLVHPGAVEPQVCRGAALEDEPVVGHGVVHDDVSRPPRVRLGLPLDRRVDEERLGVGREPHVHRRDTRLVGHPDPHRDGVPQGGVGVGDVEGGAVVVGLTEEVGAGLDGRHFTEPWVRPPTR